MLPPPEHLKPKSGHGGKRPGAGRKPKGYVAPTKLPDIDLRALMASAAPDNVEPLAARHGASALESLVKQLVHGASEPAKISAANAILDRGYGKPAIDVGGEPALPFMAAPKPQTETLDVRAEARRYAHLAVAVLQRIAAEGQSENARVSASRSLLDRGYGLVGAAKLPDDLGLRPLGKREEAQQAAAAAASGRFAPPPPPGGRLDLQ